MVSSKSGHGWGHSIVNIEGAQKDAANVEENYGEEIKG